MKIKFIQRMTALNHISKFVGEMNQDLDISLGLYNSFTYDLIFSDEESDLVILIESSVQLFKASTSFESAINSYLAEVEEVLTKYPLKQFIIANLEDFSVSTTNEEIRRANEKIMLLAQQHGNSIVFDLSFLKKHYGLAYCEDFRLIDTIAYNGSVNFQKAIAEQLTIIIEKVVYQDKKVIISDLDNTFWQGVIGDDGYSNLVHNGICTQYYREYLKQAKKNGKFVACISKNSPTIVQDEQVRACLDEYFIEQELSWNKKSTVVKQLAQKFNVGLDSIVFIDDNLSEIEEVKANCSGVKCYQYQPTIEWINKLYAEQDMQTLIQTKTDANRIKNYQIQQSQTEHNYENYADYLQSLNPQITISKLNDTNINRAVQLLNKTNQFNNNKQLFSLEELKKCQFNNEVIVVDYQDKFITEEGISVVIYTKESSEIVIKNWVMSCRVFQKTIEDKIIDYLSKDSQQVKMYFKPSAKNHVMKEFLADKLIIEDAEN